MMVPFENASKDAVARGASVVKPTLVHAWHLIARCTRMKTLLVPRWSGDASSDWYPSLARSRSVEIIPLLPTKEAPEIEPGVRALEERIVEDAFLIGHSVGCQVVMRALATSPVVVDTVLLVAGWWTVDSPWDSLRPWIDRPFDWARARAAARRIEVLISDDDPFTRDHATTRRLFEERLGARVSVVKGGKHFNGDSSAARAAILALDPPEPAPSR